MQPFSFAVQFLSSAGQGWLVFLFSKVISVSLNVFGVLVLLTFCTSVGTNGTVSFGLCFLNVPFKFFYFEVSFTTPKSPLSPVSFCLLINMSSKELSLPDERSRCSIWFTSIGCDALQSTCSCSAYFPFQIFTSSTPLVPGCPVYCAAFPPSDRIFPPVRSSSFPLALSAYWTSGGVHSNCETGRSSVPKFH